MMMRPRIQPERWGLKTSDSGELMIGNHGVLSFAQTYGTPLHVVNERRLIATAERFVRKAAAAYPGKVSAYYPLKCNSVPAVVEAVCSAGLNAEVMTEYELDLAGHLGLAGRQIIVNGPGKTDHFLRRCLRHHVRFIIVDSLEELIALDGIARCEGMQTDILLRVNPGYRPRTVNAGTATGTRQCAFGLDMKGGEVNRAFELLGTMDSLKFCGLHMHIGTGIRDPLAYARAIRSMKPAFDAGQRRGFAVRVLDVGGGFASATTREFTTAEMFAYQTWGRLSQRVIHDPVDIREFVHQIAHAVSVTFEGGELPELLYEPGRCIAGPNQFLLLTVCRTKHRSGIGTWLIADGGLSTVTLPTYYEHHDVLLCNEVFRPCTERVHLIGPACFAGDIIYRNKLMPEVHPGEIIAVMDTGAYFTALESSFGFPRPAILAVNGAECRIIRSRETYEEMVSRDIFNEEKSNGIRSQEAYVYSRAG